MQVGMIYKGFKITQVKYSKEDKAYCGIAESDVYDQCIKFFSKEFSGIEHAFKDACNEYLDYLAYNQYADDMAKYLERYTLD